MGDIAKGVLGGGWSLLVGWILPTAINLGILAITMGPSLRQVPVANQIFTASPGAKALLLLIASVLTGLILNALQVPLYRVLEGYLLWPARLYARRSRHHRKRRSELADELTRTRRARRAAAERVQSAGTAQRSLTPDGEAPAVPDPRDEVLTATQQALLGERLARYPVQDDQVTPTRLGNAIRRLEEYGYDRYRLDSQVLWNELTAMAPEQARRQVDTARTSVDFFIALLYGHTVLVAIALCATSVDSVDPPILVGTAGAGAQPVQAGCGPHTFQLGVVGTRDSGAPAMHRAQITGQDALALSGGGFTEDSCQLRLVLVGRPQRAIPLIRGLQVGVEGLEGHP